MKTDNRTVRQIRGFKNGRIPASQVTVTEATRFNKGPLFLVAMHIQLLGGQTKDIHARYDLDKSTFIDVFPNQDVMYQLRRVELTVGEMLIETFKL